MCTVLLASVLGQADVAVCLEKMRVHPKASISRSEFCWQRDHTRSLRLSLALVMVLTMNPRRFQRTPSFVWNGNFIQRVKGFWNGNN